MNIGPIKSLAGMLFDRAGSSAEVAAPAEKKPAPKSPHYNVTISDEALAMARGQG